MNSGTKVSPTLDLSVRTAGGVTIAELTGEVDIASVPALREQLLRLLRPGSSRLVIDLSNVSLCDASGLAALVGAGRRARLLGGFLRLAAVSPQVGRVLHLAGLLRSFAIFPTVQAAATGPWPAQARKAGTAATSAPAARALHGPAGRHSRPHLVAPSPATPSPAVAATATRLRRVLNPASRPATT
jgi:anti-sigma B factor antagonist